MLRAPTWLQYQAHRTCRPPATPLLAGFWVLESRVCLGGNCSLHSLLYSPSSFSSSSLESRMIICGALFGTVGSHIFWGVCGLDFVSSGLPASARRRFPGHLSSHLCFVSVQGGR